MPVVDIVAAHRMPSGCFFALAFEGRTGSSHVVSSLNTHPDALCYPEILADVKGPRQKDVLDAFFEGRPVERECPHAANARYFGGRHVTKARFHAVGFKLKLQQVHDLPGFHARLASPSVRLVYLKRKNLVKAAVSEINAQRLWRKTGLWNAEEPSQVQGGVKVNPDRLVRALERRGALERAHRAFFEICGNPRLELQYEDLLADRDTFLSRLLAFLELEDLPMAGGFYKNTPDCLREAILNYREVSRVLKGRGYGEYLE